MFIPAMSGMKFLGRADDVGDAIKAADGISDTVKAVETTTDAAKSTDTLKTVLDASDDPMTEMAKGSKDTYPVITVKEKTTALREVENLPPSIQRSAKSFYKRGSNHYNNFSLTKNGDNTYTMIMEKPGNVHGSKAVYYKIVDNDGNLIKVYKDTFDPYGKLIHRKDK